MPHHRKKTPVASTPSSKSETNGPEPFDIYLLRDESIKIEGETLMTTEQAKKLFAGTIQDQYGLKRSEALESIASITAYVPVREEKIGDEWVAAKVDNDRDTMANVFSQNHTGLLVFQLSGNFKSTHEIQTPKDKGLLERIEGLLERIDKMEEIFKAEVKRLNKDLNAVNQDLNTVNQDLNTVNQDLNTVNQDLNAERKRANLAEENLAKASAAIEENIAEVNSYIANGSREDTTAFYCIKIRHLVSLVQARLAYAAGWSTSPDERNGSLIWRNQFITSVELDSKEKKIAKATEALRNSIREDQAHLNTIVTSEALKILVDDSDLRCAGDTAAHPGPLTNNSIEGYRTAVQAIGGKNASTLESYITFLSCYAS